MYNKDKLISQDSSPHSPHQIIPGLIKPNSFVLDIGCNGGHLGKILQSRQITTDGIDINPTLLKQAAKYYRHTYQKDLYYPDFTNIKHTYDYIVLSDILEHLPSPDLVLLRLKPLLNKNAQIIVSLPNVARLEIRLQLLLGKFNYSPGILSPDHLRFFTYHSAIDLFHHCGYHLIFSIPTGLGHQIKILPKLTAFQFVYVLEIL